MAAAILARAGASVGVASLARSGSYKPSVIARAKEMREYREDTGEVTVQGQGKGDKALYADQVPPQARKKDNMSREMKERLRKEYVGFGGAENKAMSSNYFLWIAVIVAVLAVMSKMIGAI